MYVLKRVIAYNADNVLFEFAKTFKTCGSQVFRKVE